MSVLTPGFAFLFFCFFLIYYSIFRNHQWILILIASILFYCSFIPLHFMIVAFLIVMNYFSGVLLGKPGTTNKKLLLVISVILNVAFLAFFKWIHAILSMIPGLSLLAFQGQSGAMIFSLVIPMGLSFLTFSFISYLVDVKRGTIPAEKNLALLAASFLYFPKILQGPIERSGSFLAKLKTRHDPVQGDIFNGLRLILWGLFKKLVVADRLGIVVANVYDHPAGHDGFHFLVATLFFSIQIYADFSGFIDIARGISKMLGIRLSENFNLPYFSRSIKEFWSRWHMTLSSWLRDYLFLPLSYYISGRLKKEKYLLLRTEMWIYIVATVITFAVCGIWHGAGWNFLTWGLLYAVFLITSRLTARSRKNSRFLKAFRKKERINQIFAVTWTFLLVSFAWIFFRANSINEGFSISWKIMSLPGYILTELFSGSVAGLKASLVGAGSGLSHSELLVAFVAVIFLFVTEYFSKQSDLLKVISRKPVYIRWSLYYILMFAIVYFGVFRDTNFIYAQF